MGRDRWKIINRCLQADLNWIENFCNKFWKDHWVPFPAISIDDDKEKWTGRGGHKSKNIKKAANFSITLISMN